MITQLSDLSHEVRILELELRKLELLPEIARLKSEQCLGAECVGCAGPCDVVDVAAKLQKEVDEYKETLRLERIDHVAETTVLSRECRKSLQYRDQVIDRLQKDIEVKVGIIKKFEKDDCELRFMVVDLHTEIQGLRVEILEDNKLRNTSEPPIDEKTDGVVKVAFLELP